MFRIIKSLCLAFLLNLLKNVNIFFFLPRLLYIITQHHIVIEMFVFVKPIRRRLIDGSSHLRMIKLACIECDDNCYANMIQFIQI